MPNLWQFVSQQFVPLLFLPAGAGILFQILSAQSLPDQILGSALLLFCPELARMAKVDLDNIAAVAAQPLSTFPRIPFPLLTQRSLSRPTDLPKDSRLRTFHMIVVSTIVLELLGFYAALVSFQWGGILIIFSQLWFNLLAKIQLFPQENQPVISFGLFDRIPVLAADLIGLALLAAWSVSEKRLELAIALLGLIALFLFVKYGLPALNAEAEQNTAKVPEDKASGE